MRKSRPSRDDFAQITDDLEFEKARLDRCRRAGIRRLSLKIMFGSAVMGAALAFFGWKRPCCTGCEQTAAVGP